MGKSKPRSGAVAGAAVPPDVVEGVGKVPTRDDVHGSTSKLFVKGLPEDATGEDLEMFFSEVGPVKRCFVVTQKGSSKCTGIGYVHFAFGEDADKALKVLKNQKFRGRSLTLTHAKKRQARSEREAIQKELREGKVAEFVGEGDDVAVQEAPKKTEKMKLNRKKERRERGETEKEKAPLLSESIAVEKKKVAARVVVLRGVDEKEHTAQWIEQTLSPYGRITAISFPSPETAYVLFLTPENAVAAVSKLGVQFKDTPFSAFLFSGALLKQFRLIVRNLPFKATLADVEAKFAPFGPLFEVQVPKGKKPGLNRGFAFVNFTNVKDATKAITGMNMKDICGRPVAVDFAVAKSEFDALEKKEEKGEDDEDKEDGKEAQEMSDDEGDDGEDGEEREEGEESYEDDDASSWTSSNDEEDDESDEVSDVGKGQTLFIRNLSYETNENEIREAFQKFGSIMFVKLVRDKETGAPRGSAFLKFRSRESAQKALEEAYESQKYANVTLSNRQRKKAKSRHDTESDIIVDGRRVMVALAVDKDEAHEQRLTESGKKERGKDKRNLYLAEIGVIKPDDPEAQKMPAIEVQKRLRAWQEKKLKLANPNFHVSPTRLAVRGLPKEVTEADLKEMFRKAALSANSKFPPAIRQVKIVRDASMKDAEGLALSRGFGFVEFKHHEHALAALQSTNNKKGIIPYQKNRTLIVDFAVENSKNLEIMKQKRAATDEISRQRLQEGERGPASPKRSRETDKDEEEQPAKRRNVERKAPKKGDDAKGETTPTAALKKNNLDKKVTTSNKREREWGAKKMDERPSKKARVDAPPRARQARPTAPRVAPETNQKKKKSNPGLKNLSMKEVRHEQTFEALVTSYKSALGARPLKKKWDE